MLCVGLVTRRANRKPPASSGCGWTPEITRNITAKPPQCPICTVWDSFVEAYSDDCPISTAITHIGSCAWAQSRFGLVLVTGFDQSKAVLASHIKPTIPLFRSVVTVMSKWLYIQPMAI